MNIWLTFQNAQHSKLYSTHLASQSPFYATTLKFSALFTLLSSIFDLIISLISDSSSLKHYSLAQSLFGFALFILTIICIVICRWKIHAHRLRSTMILVLVILDIIISSEIYFINQDNLDTDDNWTSIFALLAYRILPSVPLVLICSTWISKSIGSLIIIPYGVFRAGPGTMAGYSAVYTISVIFTLSYFFYIDEKTKKTKFLESNTIQNREKLVSKALNSLPEGLAVLDTHNDPILVNQPMTKVLGAEDNEQAAIKKINDLRLEYIIPEIKKHLENPQIDRSFSNMMSPGKSHSPQHDSTPSTPHDHQLRSNFDRNSSSMTKLLRPKVSKSGVSIPSIYLDDLKYRRKMTRKHSSKDYSEEFKVHFKENSLLLECMSPQHMSKSRSALNINSPVENTFKLRVDGEKLKGYIANPVKEGDCIVFNLHEEIGKKNDVFAESDYIPYEVRYREFSFEKQEYKLVIITDISKKEKLINLEESNKYKKLMFASISHEFRTPVNGIIGLLELASRGGRSPHLNAALNSVQMLLFLIDDMLDYSQILADELRLHIEAFSVKDCLEEVKELMQDQAGIKDIDMQLTIKKTAPSHVKSDKKRIQQVLVNLLSNAIKFTNKHGYVEVTVEGVNYSSHCLRISVRDTGIGLNSSDRERLHINMNNMNDGHISRKVSSSSSGVGLGLIITQSLSLALGPSEEIAPGVAGITVESQYGEGSVFQFVVYNHEILGTLDEIVTIETLPDEQSPQQKKSTIVTTLFDPKSGMSHPNFATTANQISPQISPRKSIVQVNRRSKTELCGCPKVLIVDDNSYNIFTLKILLNSFKIQCDCAYDGLEACKMVIQADTNRKGCCRGYSLVFMDCNMPIMNGFDATKELKGKMKNKEINNVPIVGWTAYTDKASVDEGMGAGMDEFITKPVTMTILGDVLRNYGLMQEK